VECFAPELRGLGLKLREVTVGVQQIARVVRKGRVGAADPVEGKVFIGVWGRLEQRTHNADTQGTGKELYVKATAATFGVVLY
tara:strand:+ start:553 stop:801 length:249 start_codon:yes stop_codon:yes gene_type:complete